MKPVAGSSGVRNPLSSAIANQNRRASTEGRGLSRLAPLRVGAVVGWIIAVTLLFIQPLTRLTVLASQNDLLSYIPLVPLVTGYLLYTDRQPLGIAHRTSLGGAVVLSAIGVAALAAWVELRGGLSVNDDLALTILAYVAIVAAGGFLFLGTKWMAARAFPISFLIFLVPLPDAAVTGLENALVLASADASAVLFRLTGTPMVRDGTILELPGIALRVAQECSGIRSTWVLLITSLVASHLFLKSPWRRVVLVAFVIPLGILRNGFRILTIGLLCVHIGPQMIDSVIHRRGGPLFFALSLGPLFLFLLWLKRQEQER